MTQMELIVGRAGGSRRRGALVGEWEEEGIEHQGQCVIASTWSPSSQQVHRPPGWGGRVTVSVVIKPVIGCEWRGHWLRGIYGPTKRTAPSRHEERHEERVSVEAKELPGQSMILSARGRESSVS
ncbi:hypothetical protein KM043_006770 [Ampulex compressa]|nr:hypothetical protein KM043_006770 [Ampulex compressa]